MEVLIPSHPLHKIVNGLSIHRWGRVTWRALHGLTFLNPHKNWKPLLECLCLLLPCPMCCMHLRHYLDMHHPTVGLDWFEYVVDLHNSVNTHQGRKLLSVHDVHHRYRMHCTQQAVLDATWEMVWVMHASADRKSRLGTVDYTPTLQDLVRLTMDDMYPRLPYVEGQSFFVSAVESLPVTSTAFRWWYLRYPMVYPHKLFIIEDVAGPMTTSLLEHPLEKHVWNFLEHRLIVRTRAYSHYTTYHQSSSVNRYKWVIVSITLTTLVVSSLLVLYILRRKTNDKRHRS